MKKFSLILLIIVTIIFSGCKSTRDVVYQHDTIYKTNVEYINQVKFDSIYIHDSVDRWNVGDTIYITKYKDKYKYQILHDTLNSTDTIVVYKDKLVETPNKKNPYKIIFWTTIALVGLGLLGKYLLKPYLDK